jgi:hypothetical protein
MMWLEELLKPKNVITSSGFEPEIFRLVAYEYPHILSKTNCTYFMQESSTRFNALSIMKLHAQYFKFAIKFRPSFKAILIS